LRLGRVVFVSMLLFGALLFPATAGANGISGLMIKKINQTRASYGLGPLHASRSLGRSSRGFSNWLMSHDVFAHRAHVSASRRFHRLGEALALHGGHRAKIGYTVRSWLRSPAHRRIVLTRSMNLVGVGCSRGRFGSSSSTIWVLQVGRL
jgi:uncharacterized protein YkwD